MKKNKNGERKVIVRVLPAEVETLHDDEIVIVNRELLNVQLVFDTMDDSTADRARAIQQMRMALNDMMEQERRQKGLVMGAAMSVKEVKQIFPQLKKMPNNSFARMEA